MATWNYTVNRTFIDEVGEARAAQWVAALGEVASRAQPGDREGVAKSVAQQFEAFGQKPNQATVDLMADNMTMRENSRMVVLDSEMHVLAEFELPGRSVENRNDCDRGVPVEAEDHKAPDDKDRPTYS